MGPFLGEIRIVGFGFPPRGWSPCDGRLLSIIDHEKLHSLLGTTYGGDGVTTFALPDLRGRVPISSGVSPTLPKYYYQQGQKGGVEKASLSISELPSHEHSARATVNANSNAGNSTTPDGSYWAGSSEGDSIYHASAGAEMNNNAVEVSVDKTGEGQAHENLPPYLVLRFIIAIDERFIYPPRD